VITISKDYFSKEATRIEAFNYAIASISIGHAVLPGLIEDHALG
jgi:hypothetical protein